jgi:hypothetical protein
MITGCGCELLREHGHLLLIADTAVLLCWLLGLAGRLIATGAGHEISKHRLLFGRGLCPWGGEKVPQAKNGFAAGASKFGGEEANS